MNVRGLLGLIFLFAGFGAVAAAKAQRSARERMDEFIAKAEQERIKSGKSLSELRGRYPTPELSLVSSEFEHEVKPGQTVDFEVKGAIPEGALTLLDCDDEVELSSFKVSKDGVKGKAKIPPTMLPRICSVQVVTPLAATTGWKRVFFVTGTYEWKLKFGNGMTAKWTTEANDGELVGEGEWIIGGKPQGPRRLIARPTEVATAWTADVQRTEEENQKAAYGLEQSMSSADMERSNAAVAALSEKMTADCAKGPPEKSAECYVRYQKQIQAAYAGLNAVMNAQQEQEKIHPAACFGLELQIVDGKVTGTARGCQKAGEVSVSGVVAPKKP